jgi:hypothetical protein
MVGKHSSKGVAVFDELQMLRGDPVLCQLLDHYAQLGRPDRTVWQDRLMEMDGDHDLTRLHGVLIAWGWLEQNTGNTAVLKPGAISHCYRITSQGCKALAWTQQDQDDEAEHTRRAA